MSLTPDDLVLMNIAHYGDTQRSQKQLSILIANAIGKMLSGKEE